MIDTVIRGPTIVNADGAKVADILVENGRVAGLVAPGTAVATKEEISLSGLIVVPGLVDAHVHFREPGLTYKEDFRTGSAAAIAGGVTSALVMPTDQPWTATPADYREKVAAAQGRILCDIGLQVAVPTATPALDELVELGAVSFEVFTADVPDAFLHRTASQVLDTFSAISRVGALAGVSPLDAGSMPDPTLDDQGIDAHLARYPAHGEALGTARSILMAERSGAGIHIRQISSELAVKCLDRLKDLADVSVEVSVQNLIFTDTDYRRLGPLIKASPPFRSARDRAALREAAAGGLIDMVVTDHSPHLLSEKLGAESFCAIPGGLPGVQTVLPAMLSLVEAGVFSLQDLVRLCCQAPADRFGLAGKGRVDLGRDADFVVLDPTGFLRVTGAEQISKAGYTPFEDLAVRYGLTAVYKQGRRVGPGMDPAGRLLCPARPRAGS